MSHKKTQTLMIGEDALHVELSEGGDLTLSTKRGNKVTVEDFGDLEALVAIVNDARNVRQPGPRSETQ